MSKIKFEFENSAGEQLAGLLELPEQAEATSSYALFAHCFTCGKDIAAASRISRALAQRGIAVLRFDFTGLGNSDGDFANSNFSSNIDDLLAAASALEKQYRAPEILIGHSLGGAAVLSAALKLESVKAVVTIAAPATAKHVAHLFAADEEQINNEGEAQVSLGGRRFSIKKQFLEDIETYHSSEQIKQLRAALLVYHSPLDSIVSIDEAAEIYTAARHPKSFISLDKADHLLSQPADSEYVAATLSAWVGRYLTPATPAPLPAAVELQEGEVLVTELDEKFLRGLHSTGHSLLADEPEEYGGSNKGPSPYDFLLMALGACTSMTLRMYANRKKLPITDIEVRLQHERVHAEDCVDCKDKIERINRRISYSGELSEEQRLRLLEIADKCPVHRTMKSDPQIVSRLD